MHIGVIPDGNRRYVKKHHLDLVGGYNEGIRRIYEFIEWCIELNVDEVTVYALSIENIKNRMENELKILASIFNNLVNKEMKEKNLKKKDIKIKFCGDEKLMKEYLRSDELIDNLHKIESETSASDGIKVNIGLAYGGRQEIIKALETIIKTGDKVSEENIRKNLSVTSDADIIIRTGEKRISNFLIWQGAYSEIYFVDKLWPEFERADLINIIEDFKSKERRFGA